MDAVGGGAGTAAGDDGRSRERPDDASTANMNDDPQRTTLRSAFARLTDRMDTMITKLENLEDKVQRVERGNRTLVRTVMESRLDHGRSLLAQLEAGMPELTDSPHATPSVEYKQLPNGPATESQNYGFTTGLVTPGELPGQPTQKVARRMDSFDMDDGGSHRSSFDGREEHTGDFQERANSSIGSKAGSIKDDRVQAAAAVASAGVVEFQEGAMSSLGSNSNSVSGSIHAANGNSRISRPTHITLPRRSPALYPPHQTPPLSRSDASRSSEYHLAEILRIVPALIFRTNQLGAQNFASTFTRQLVGADASETLGYGFSSFIHPDDRQMVLDYSMEKQLKQEAIDLNYRLIRRDNGVTIWCRTIASPSFDPETGAFIGYVGAVVDVTDTMEWRREAEEKNRALGAALIEARQAAEAKDAFLANISHELRTPLNGIIGMANLLRLSPLFTPTSPASAEPPTSPSSLDRSSRHATPEEHDILDMLCQCSEGLLTIVNDLLDISSVSNRQLQLTPSVFSPAHITNAAVEVMKLRATKKSITLTLDARPDVPSLMWGDQVRIRQVLFNLLENSLKFTEEGGRITVDLTVEETTETALPEGCDQTYMASGAAAGQLLVIQVTDTGCGFTADEAENMFEPFTQSDSSMSRKHGGVGLGLAISKQLLTLMGGSISADSAGPGEGSSFTCRIPIMVPHQMEAERLNPTVFTFTAPSATLQAEGSVEPITKEDKDKKRNGMLRVGPRRSGTNDSDSSNDQHQQQTSYYSPTISVGSLISTPASEYDRSLGRPDCKILLAEDNAINVKLTLKLLSKLGYPSCDVASDGQECVDMVLNAVNAENDTYDLVLCDLQMPRCSGYEAAEMIRDKVPEGMRPPIVALTANVMEKDRERCMEVGMVGFLGKPLRMAELGLAVEKYRRRSGAASRE